ncbi:phosphoadenylyl-sulfate reductase [Pseudooctadecabacter sp.]|uniref:phosphoadenylyl-sulfate reductase n=1 Tax=Pseudooctadecabacter sp. TaxID=1966338 RepID=UPI0025E6C51D|nr:phosphoadenylyl-sulfate reductase [Pseudooctadecabacter sp.]
MPLDGRTQTLNRLFKDREALDVVDHALTQLGEVAMVSSFGADSVVLLHMAAQVDRNARVVFIDTEMLFPETLAYQTQVADTLGLTNVDIIRAPRAAVFERDNENLLHLHDPDACCHLRKTEPLDRALRGVDAWITGRKRHQGGARAALDLFEVDRPLGQLPRIKVNPLAHWDSDDLRGYIEAHSLPRHPLVAKGYPSIGCVPCTSPVGHGEDVRAGRWRDQGKTECGIHFGADGVGRST